MYKVDIAMYHTFLHLRSSELTSKVFWVSFFVFATLNTVENIIHYSIGRDNNRDTLSIKFKTPSVSDFIRIISVMAVFALLQAALTCYFLRC